MPEQLLFIPWAVGVVYSSIPLFWFAIHPFAARWQRMRRSPYLVLLPLWAVVIAALGALTWKWRAHQIYSAWWAWGPALPLFFAGARTYSRIRAAFGVEKFTGLAELRPAETQQALVVTGLHARMRHPIYIAHLTMFAAWTLGSGLLVNYALLALSVLCTYPLMISLEERELVKRFGSSYLEYRKSVPLVPCWMSHSNRESALAETARRMRKP